MKKLFGTLVGGGLVGVGLLMIIGTLGTVAEGKVLPQHGLVTGLFLTLFIVLGAVLLRWAWRAGPVQILTDQGQIVTMPAAMVPGSQAIGSVVQLGDTRSVATLPTGEAKQALALAEAALSARDYPRAYSLYEQAIQQHPSTAPLAYANMGVCCFFFRQYERAIQLYELARQHGANPWAMEENITEARQAMAAPR
jgi:thioredoxin-like negative regulator of GroEL